ncbi:uncharacterized protein LAESUDRAFT_548117 [Laetiporus sulphureus 93-53]|uniref:Uncharacterized protein n=1 Tax=Laetiporus sulphureus 93-53 TaxID=1314785 RepID=A0A165FQD8_9APHY|nr:uncharacterized protein LAESUDRAFT_548117 [Laetiporus sulphureus 93-53]KZT09320.1 hypothetical protein LAESUDRAFT_548117 [Laetiporus sulphureus 93-53]
MAVFRLSMHSLVIGSAPSTPTSEMVYIETPPQSIPVMDRTRAVVHPGPISELFDTYPELAFRLHCYFFWDIPHSAASANDPCDAHLMCTCPGRKPAVFAGFDAQTSATRYAVFLALVAFVRMLMEG